MHYKIVLKNGFKIIFIPRKNSPICRINVHINAGSIYDEKEFKLGTSHFVEHMVFQGSKKYPKRDDLLNLIYSTGGSRGALTSHFEQRHFVTISNQYVEKAFEYFSQTLLHPIFSIDDFKKEKNIIQNEFRLNESSILKTFYTKGVNKTIFKTTSLQNYPLGNNETIKQILLNDIKSFHNTFFNTNRMTLFISGDYTKEKITELGEKYFNHSIKKRNLSNYKIEINSPQNTEILNINSKEVKISCAQFLPNISNSQYYSLLFLIQILCVGRHARLFKELREKRSLIYSIYPNNMNVPEGLLIGIVTQSKDKNIEKIKKIILSEIKKISINSVSSDELLRVKLIYKQNIIIQNDSTIGICDAYFKNFRKFREIYNIKKENELIDSVCLNDIKNAAKQILKNKMSWIKAS